MKKLFFFASKGVQREGLVLRARPCFSVSPGSAIILGSFPRSGVKATAALPVEEEAFLELLSSLSLGSYRSELGRMPVPEVLTAQKPGIGMSSVQ